MKLRTRRSTAYRYSIWLGVAVLCLVVAAILGSGQSPETPSSQPVTTPLATRDYYNELESYWHPLGAGANYNEEEHSFQCIISGDLTGTGEMTALTNYHHGQVGLFLHTLEGTEWEKQVLAAWFVPSRLRDGWPVKGLVGGDIDNDGYKEIITCADVISFPTGVQSKWRPFPGVIYIDLNDPGYAVNPRPLVWGAWGERLASRDFANTCPIILPPAFRSPENHLPDIMVPTSTKIDGKSASRIFILEQPPGGFGAYDYSYVTPDTIGTYPFETEAFYVRHLYVSSSDSPGMLRPMTFLPDRFPGAGSAVILGVETLDFDSDGIMDLVVSVLYYDGIDEIGSDIVFYRRLPPSDQQYVFDEVQRIRTEGFGLKGITAVNADGDPSNSKESLIAGIGPAGTSMPKSVLACLLPSDGGYRLQMLACADDTPYRGTYSNVVVLDGNADGYDDFIVYCTREPTEEGMGYGDVVYFENVGRGSSISPYVVSPEHLTVLMSGQSPSWSLCLQQADNDDELELTVSLMNKLPYWRPSTSAQAHAYYCDIYDVVGDRRH